MNTVKSLTSVYTIFSKRRRSLKKSKRWSPEAFNQELDALNQWYVTVQNDDPNNEEAQNFLANWRAMLALDRLEDSAKNDANQLPLLL